MYFLPQQVPEHEKKYETVSRQMYDFQTFRKVIHSFFLSNPADEQTNRQTEAKTKRRWQQQKWSVVDSNLSQSHTHYQYISHKHYCVYLLTDSRTHKNYIVMASELYNEHKHPSQ